jgi:hypothetical protein
MELAVPAQSGRGPLPARGRSNILLSDGWTPRARNFLLDHQLCPRCSRPAGAPAGTMESAVHSLIYLIGLIVVIMAILSFFGLR